MFKEIGYHRGRKFDWWWKVFFTRQLFVVQ